MDSKGETHVCQSPIAVLEQKPRSDLLDMQLRYLIIVRGGIPGTMLRLAQDASSLGRSAENTFQLHDNTVSRRHAVLSVDSFGTAWVTDLGSSNGTFLDGKRIPPQTTERVSDGARIQLGSVVILKYLKLDECDEGFQREMFERIVRDSLTGLYNRGFFLNQIGPLADLNAMRELGLAIILLDLDRFKAINDMYGHAEGDGVLRQVAGALRESARGEDLVARYGGEEFILALPSSSLDQAAERAEIIRQKLSELDLQVGGKRLRVTASAGVSFNKAGRIEDLGVLISEADAALYRAKRTGRNRVVVASHGMNQGVPRTASADAFAAVS